MKTLTYALKKLRSLALFFRVYRGAALQPSECLNELRCSIVAGNARTMICLTYLLHKVICCSTQIAERTERKVQCHIWDILRRIWHCTFAQNYEISWCHPFVALKETSVTPTRSLNYNSTSWWLFVRTNPTDKCYFLQQVKCHLLQHILLQFFCENLPVVGRRLQKSKAAVSLLPTEHCCATHYLQDRVSSVASQRAASVIFTLIWIEVRKGS